MIDVYNALLPNVIEEWDVHMSSRLELRTLSKRVIPLAGACRSMAVLSYIHAHLSHAEGACMDTMHSDFCDVSKISFQNFIFLKNPKNYLNKMFFAFHPFPPKYVKKTFI